jgi:hypothetical protein
MYTTTTFLHFLTNLFFYGIEGFDHWIIGVLEIYRGVVISREITAFSCICKMTSFHYCYSNNTISIPRYIRVLPLRRALPNAVKPYANKAGLNILREKCLGKPVPGATVLI